MQVFAKAFVFLAKEFLRWWDIWGFHYDVETITKSL